MSDEEDEERRVPSRWWIWTRRLLFVLAAIFLLYTFVNASWLAPIPKGTVKLIAHRGVTQQIDRASVGADTCTAAHIEPPMHDYLEYSIRSLDRTLRTGLAMIEVDFAPTADGEIVLFHEWTLDCRTNGSGPVREKTLAELQKLDAGYGYTADGGKSFPLRGRSTNRMPTLAEALSGMPRTPILFNFKSDDPGEADLLAAALRKVGRDVAKVGDGFYGAPAPVARIAELYPDNWAWSTEAATRCSSDYVLWGWTGFLPESCEGATMVIPLDQQWKFWGWPNRLIARMEKAGGRIIVTGPYTEGEPAFGINLPEQLGEIPSTFNGYIWVEDIWTIGPALFPSRDPRSPSEINASIEALARRRARQ